MPLNFKVDSIFSSRLIVEDPPVSFNPAKVHSGCKKMFKNTSFEISVKRMRGNVIDRVFNGAELSENITFM